MNRKKFFFILWASVFLTRLWFEGIGNPVWTFLGSAIEGCSLPGWIVVAGLRHVAPSVVAAHDTAIAVIGAVAFWFFPLARVRRWFGTYDAFTAGKRSRFSPIGALAHAIEEVNKRLFGRKKTAGWG